MNKPPPVPKIKQKSILNINGKSSTAELKTLFEKQNAELEKHYKDIKYKILNEEIIIKEDLDGGVAGSVWISCVSLCEHIIKNYSEILKNKLIIELGSGTGLGGLALALHGAKVIFTDLKPALPLIQLNIDANPNVPTHNLNIEELDWYYLLISI